MKLEDQVCSLELAKKLKELGVKQESYFFWVFSYNGGDIKLWNVFPYWHEEVPSFSSKKTGAFTVAELGEMLPLEIQEENRKPYQLAVNHFAHIGWQVGYENNGGTWAYHLKADDNLFQQDVTEADARALMLIYLLENKLITV